MPIPAHEALEIDVLKTASLHPGRPAAGGSDRVAVGEARTPSNAEAAPSLESLSADGSLSIADPDNAELISAIADAVAARIAEARLFTRFNEETVRRRPRAFAACSGGGMFRDVSSVFLRRPPVPALSPRGAKRACGIWTARGPGRARRR